MLVELQTCLDTGELLAGVEIVQVHVSQPQFAVLMTCFGDLTETLTNVRFSAKGVYLDVPF